MKALLLVVVLLAGSLVLATVPSRAFAAELEAGVAVVDITPPIGYRMCGYFNERLSTGVRDPLLAKALVLRQGDCRAAMVFCDLVGLTRDVTDRTRKAVQKLGIPPENVLIAATHSHTGPLYAGALREFLHDRAVKKHGFDPCETVDYPAQLVEGLAAAMARAHAALRPVKLQAGLGQETGLSFNRRFHMKDGSVVFNPGRLNPNIVRAAGPVDPDVGLLMFRSPADGRALASVTVFALHLDTLGGTLYSADYPFYLSESLRKDLGSGLVSMFGNGTCGDINHIDVSTDRPQPGGGPETKRIGEALAAKVKAVLPGLKDQGAPRLAVQSETVMAPLQNFGPDEIAWAKAAMEKLGTSELGFLDQVRAYKILDRQLRKGDLLPIEVQVFRFSDEVALVALPGEVFVEIGLAIKKASPFPVTMVIELANDTPDYIPTKRAFAEGSYETVNSRIQPGGGEMAIDAAVRVLKQLKE
jgi:hypothetical protein